LQIVRTILWVMVAIAIMLFSILNWNPVEITLWDGILVETKVPALVILAFLLGLFPMWLYHRSVKWGLDRRIRSLENSIKSAALAHSRETPVDGAGDKPVDSPASAPVVSPVDNPVEKPADSLSPVHDAQDDTQGTNKP